MKIFIDRMRLRARHGVMPQERQVGQDFLVSVEAETPNEQSTQTDRLEDTVSYAEMADAVRREMGQPSLLLEHVCGRIARRLLSAFPTLSRVTVRITKLAPPITGLQCQGSGVELTLARGD